MGMIVLVPLILNSQIGYKVSAKIIKIGGANVKVEKWRDTNAPSAIVGRHNLGLYLGSRQIS